MMAAKGRTVTWLEENLWAILCAISSAGGGVLIGMTTTNHRLEVLEKHVADIGEKQQRRTDFNVCVVRSIDRLNAELKLQPTCPLEVPE